MSNSIERDRSEIPGVNTDVDLPANLLGAVVRMAVEQPCAIVSQLPLPKVTHAYANHDERRDAYRDFLTNLATMQAVFSQPDSMHVAGYLAAHERVADGDADHPDDGELWAGRLNNPSNVT